MTAGVCEQKWLHERLCLKTELTAVCIARNVEQVKAPRSISEVRITLRARVRVMFRVKIESG